MSWPNHLTKFSNESYKHFMAKASLFYLLRRMKHEVASEWNCGNGYIDIVDKTTMVFYEIELSGSSNFRNRKVPLYDSAGYDLIIINCSRMPSDIIELNKNLEKYIRPD